MIQKINKSSAIAINKTKNIIFYLDDETLNGYLKSTISDDYILVDEYGDKKLLTN